MMYPLHKKTAQKGFTLVETLVATFVLITAIVGPLSIVAKGVFFSSFAKDQVTASYLAQEAIEYIHNKRENVTLADQTWSTFKSNNGAQTPPGIAECFVVNNPNGCKIDVKYDTIASCPSICEVLKQDSFGLYNYVDGPESGFKRIIKVYNEPTSDVDANEMRIEVEMVWRSGTINKNFVLRESLFNWQ